MIRSVWWLLLVLVVGCGRAAERAPVDDARLARWRADLAFVGRELPARHVDAFFHQPEPAFRAALAAIDADLARLDDDQIATRLTQLVAGLGDGHTRIAAALDPQYPLRLMWFADGVFVLAAPASEAWAVGGEIVAIGGRPTTDAVARLATVASHDNASQLRAAAPAALLQPALVRGLGLAQPDGTLALTIRAGAAHRLLVLAPTGVKPTRPPPTRVALASRAPQRAYWSEYLPAERALFVQYNQCRDAEPPFAELVAGLAAVLDRQPVERLIVDLRGNGGGDSRIFAPLLALIAQHPTLRVVALIGRHTFSSAVLNALELEAAGAILVGEVAGGAPSHHGEVQSFALPGHPLTVYYSTKYFANPQHPGRELAPTVTVAPTAADYFAGTDAALAAALAVP